MNKRFRAARRQEAKDVIEQYEEGTLSHGAAIKALVRVGYRERASQHMLETGRAY